MVEYTSSRLITVVKQLWTYLVATWMGIRLGTAGVVGFSFSHLFKKNPFFFFLTFSPFSPLLCLSVDILIVNNCVHSVTL